MDAANSNAALLADAKAKYLRAWGAAKQGGKEQIAAAGELLAVARQVRASELDHFDILPNSREARGENAKLARLLSLHHAAEIATPVERTLQMTAAERQRDMDAYSEAAYPFTWLSMIYQHAYDRDNEMERAKLRGEIDGIVLATRTADATPRWLVWLILGALFFALGAWLAS